MSFRGSKIVCSLDYICLQTKVNYLLKFQYNKIVVSEENDLMKYINGSIGNLGQQRTFVFYFSYF